MDVPAFVVGAVLAVACFLFGVLSLKEDRTRKISDGKMFGVLAIFDLLMIFGMSNVQVAAEENGVRSRQQSDMHPRLDLLGLVMASRRTVNPPFSLPDEPLAAGQNHCGLEPHG